MTNTNPMQYCVHSTEWLRSGDRLTDITANYSGGWHEQGSTSGNLPGNTKLQRGQGYFPATRLDVLSFLSKKDTRGPMPVSSPLESISGPSPECLKTGCATVATVFSCDASS